MLADRIVVLDKGRINQSGNHAALLNEPGIYQDLCRVQGAVQDEIDALLKPQAKSQTALDGQANRSGDVSVDTHLQPTIPSKIGPVDTYNQRIIEIDNKGKVIWEKKIPRKFKKAEWNAAADIEWLPETDTFLIVAPKKGFFEINRKFGTGKCGLMAF